ELADKADVHRATFYSHYKDIYDLYEQLENAVVDELSAMISKNPPSTYEELFKIIIDYVYDNAQTCRMLFNGNGNRDFYNRVSGSLEEIYIADWLRETGQNEAAEEWRFFAKYHIQGCLAIVNRWADADYAYPKNGLISIIIRASTNLDKIMP
ncbi:MAG: TetR family transcriptional regulator C-terminal domain-containing protein, partial [Clostridiales Family XIII bacterium]|nr:TetR family transcriptional regulator C-terminal domain-containing protein [Clostridiales Family XIII bacterium]